jgi:hypothetical protein
MTSVTRYDQDNTQMNKSVRLTLGAVLLTCGCVAMEPPTPFDAASTDTTATKPGTGGVLAGGGSGGTAEIGGPGQAGGTPADADTSGPGDKGPSGTDAAVGGDTSDARPAPATNVDTGAPATDTLPPPVDVPNAPVDSGPVDLLPIERAWPWDGDFDAAVVWPNGSAYFFRGPEYQRVNPTTGVQTLATAPITKYWTNWPADFADGIDAVADLRNGKAYFFKGDKVARFDIAADRVDDGYPHTIANDFPGFPAAFNAKFDAISAWPADSTLPGSGFVFTGKEYVRFSRATNKPDNGYPLPFAPYWHGIPTSWPKTTLCLVWPGGKVFFKSGTQYVRYDIAADKADPGYPRAFK